MNLINAILQVITLLTFLYYFNVILSEYLSYPMTSKLLFFPPDSPMENLTVCKLDSSFQFDPQFSVEMNFFNQSIEGFKDQDIYDGPTYQFREYKSEIDVWHFNDSTGNLSER